MMLITLIAILCVAYIKSTKGFLDALCKTIVIWSLYIYVLTQILSVNSEIKYQTLHLIWMLSAVFSLIVLLLISIKEKSKRSEQLKKIQKTEKESVVFLSLFFAYSIVMLWFAYHIVPYNWDSMTYHLTRILAWDTNQSIAHYATTIKRTVGSPVFAEVINLQVYILAHGNDHWLNVLQCVSYLLNILFVYGIGRKIGCKRNAAVFASIIFMATPIAFAEALTTQVDEFSALWLLLFVYVILDLVLDKKNMQMDHSGIARMILLAFTAGFGYLTKPSVMIGMFVFTFWLLIVCIRRHDKPALILKWIMWTLFCALSLIAPEIIRNLFTYGAISDPWQGKGQIVHSIDPRYLFVGFLKNLFFNLPSTYWPDINHILLKIVYWFAYILHINADSEAISESARAFSLAQPGDYGCDSAVSPIPVMLMLICIVVYIYKLIRGRIKWSRTAGYSTISFVAFLFFCVIARWEPWVGRYMIPYLALICPAIAVQIWKIGKKGNRLFIHGFVCGIIAVMCITELSGLFRTSNKIIEQMQSESRAQGYYYYNNEAYENVYLPLTKELSELRNEKVGIVTGEDTYTYPIMKFVKDTGSEIQFVNTGNNTSVYENMEYIPDVIILMDVGSISDNYRCHGVNYHIQAKISDNCYVMCK